MRAVSVRVRQSIRRYTAIFMRACGLWARASGQIDVEFMQLIREEKSRWKEKKSVRSRSLQAHRPARPSDREWH